MAQNILVIDDEKAIRKTLAEILTFEGFVIDEAADGAEGAKRERSATGRSAVDRQLNHGNDNRPPFRWLP